MLRTHVRLDSKYSAVKMRCAGLPTGRFGVALQAEHGRIRTENLVMHNTPLGIRRAVRAQQRGGGVGEGNHQPFCPDPEAFDDCRDQLIGLEPRKGNGALHGQHVAAALVLLLRMEQAADEDHA